VVIVKQHDRRALLREVDRGREPDRPRTDHNNRMQRRFAVLIG
jgi:hypothetical protein